MSSTDEEEYTGKVDSLSSESTKERILDATLALMLKRGDVNLTMADIAKAAKVSRQGVYLHFADRGALMAALVQHADEKRGIAKEIQKVVEAPNGVAALREMAGLQARTNPGIWAAARAVDAVRRTDPAAEQAWQDRLEHRLAGARQVVYRLKKEGTLRAGLDAETAADLLWTITSLRTWEDLVLGRRWSAGQYEARIAEVLVRTLTRERG